MQSNPVNRTDLLRARGRPPSGVAAHLHQDIMRRIQNRYFENGDICSLRRNGPGLKELAGLIPLLQGLPAKAVKRYAGELAKLCRPVDCLRCRAKLYALLHLILREVDEKKSNEYLIRMLEKQLDLAERGEHRDFRAELRAVIESQERGSG